METKFDGKENKQPTVMGLITERLEDIIGRNISVKNEMTEKLNNIFPSQKEDEKIICNEESNDYANKIAVLLDILERTTTSHEFNLLHLKQIV